MIGNYFKVASRNILKRKMYSFINAFGLSVGIAFCILIFLFIMDEKSFDQFHANKNQIYRIEGHWLHYYSAEELLFVIPASRFKHVDIRDGEWIWFLVRPNELLLPAGFNPERYLELNPDVAAGGADPAAHWKEYGYREGRRW